MDQLLGNMSQLVSLDRIPMRNLAFLDKVVVGCPVALAACGWCIVSHHMLNRRHSWIFLVINDPATHSRMKECVWSLDTVRLPDPCWGSFCRQIIVILMMVLTVGT
jgi:hypothetical protein